MQKQDENMVPRGADVIVSILFTKLIDPSNSTAKIGAGDAGEIAGNPLKDVSAEKLFDYMRPWYESLHAHPALRGVVLYDDLPPAFIERWRSPQVSFQSFTLDEPYGCATSGFIQRMLALRQFLAARRGVSRIWFTDINDVGFVLDPFTWMDRLPFAGQRLFAGEEWTTFGKSEWWSGSASFFGGEYLSLFSGTFADMYLVSAGVWGGHRDVVMPFLDQFVHEIDLLLAAGFDLRTVPGSLADMFVVNLVIYRDFLDRLVSFKMNAQVGRPPFEPGAFVRGTGNPIIHDRTSAIEMVGELTQELPARAPEGAGITPVE